MVSLGKTHYPLLSTDSTQEDRKLSNMTEILLTGSLVDLDVKHQNKQLYKFRNVGN